MVNAENPQTFENIDLVILAGGAATRLGTMAGQTPKALLPVSGVPFMALQVAEMARNARIRRVLACVRKGAAHHFREFARTLQYPLVILEENEPLGTGGAILNALDQPGLSDPFIVANGDVLFRMDTGRLVSAARLHGAALSVINVPDAARFGAVAIEEGKITRFAEKGSTGPGLISAGLYAFTHKHLNSFERCPCSFETDIAPVLAGRNCMAAVPMNGPFIDIGTPRNLASADRFVDRFGS